MFDKACALVFSSFLLALLKDLLAEVLHAFDDRGIFAAFWELTFDVREDLVKGSFNSFDLFKSGLSFVHAE